MVAMYQYRMLRMAMILMIVALTIFLYAFYYTNPSITTPVHSSSGAAQQSVAYIGVGTSDADISGASGNKSVTGQHQQGLLPGKSSFVKFQTIDKVFFFLIYLIDGYSSVEL